MTLSTISEQFKILAEHLPTFKIRPGQQQMSEFITQRLQSDGPKVAIIEAPTGVGKTLAYLLGVLAIAKKEKKTLVVSTATVNLQQQLLTNDLPLIASALAPSLRYVEAKGRRRYLCPSLLTQRYQQQQQLTLLKKSDNTTVEQVITTLYERWQQDWCGDKDLLDTKLPDSVWHTISTDSEGCGGKQCRDYHHCPYYRVKEAMSAADVIVANHDVVLSDADLGGGLVLPEPESAIFVFDEAHQLPKKAIDHAAKVIDFEDLLPIIELAESLLKPLKKLLSYRGDEFTGTMMTVQHNLSGLHQILQQMRLCICHDQQVIEWSQHQKKEYRLFWQQNLVIALIEPCQALLQYSQPIYQHFATMIKWIKSGVENTDITAKSAERILPQAGTVQNKVGYIIDFCNLFLSEPSQDQPPNVRWLSCHMADKSQPILHVSPMSAAAFLSEQLWQRSYASVITSATLRGMGLFQRFRTECGLQQFGQEYFLAVSSPFDYQKKAQLHLPKMRYLPQLEQQQWQQELVTRLQQDINIHEATLVLFTARKVMEYVYQQLPMLQQYIIWQQRGVAIKGMIQEHKLRIEAGQGSILFGLDSFAEGVDLPGKFCQHVIITKLPFPVFTQPVEQAKQEWIIKQGGDPFQLLSLPMTSMKLIQACGRLLRTESDSGRITLLDARVKKQRYGRQLLQALPQYQIEHSPSLSETE
ncbi:MAG TPA: ATP-dependent DNA helicase DinG [Gammaproteobacteria bacterium]|nr:ATP-dependent DNA helicase DinG [Gammaproteobacteria bacterium]